MMNRSIYHITTLLWVLPLLIGVLSCKRLLDTQPLDQFSNEVFWTSEENVLLALTGVYRGNIQMNNMAEFSPTDWWSYQGLIFLETATDNGYHRSGDNNAFNRLSNGTMTPDIGHLGLYWQRSYQRIARANFFLENVDQAPVDDGLIDRFKAEARFIRACQYFYMSQFWGSVPLVLQTLTMEEANTVEKASKQDIVDFVLREFAEIATYLPTDGNLSNADRGRATRQAALAFLGRMQLAEGLYSEAAESYRKIVESGDHIIDPDYESLFNSTNRNSRELIFATQYLQDVAGNGILQHTYPARVGGWHTFCPLGDIVEAYQFDDGTPFSYEDPRFDVVEIGKNRDPRLDLSVLYNEQIFRGVPYTTHPDSVDSPDQLTTSKQATRTGYALRKWNYENFASGNLQNSSVNLPIIRYAEVLLSYLEAKLEAGDPIDRALLDLTINAVRAREGVEMPPVTVTERNELRTLLRNERRVELAFEGIRYWDLLRWDIAKNVLNGDFYGASYPGARNLRTKGGVRDPHDRWYVTSKSFRENIDQHWMIPQSEVNINPNLR